MDWWYRQTADNSNRVWTSQCVLLSADAYDISEKKKKLLAPAAITDAMTLKLYQIVSIN